MSDLERGLIQFSQACLPPLLPGQYRIRAEQHVREIRDDPFVSEMEFAVAGPRFDLNPTDVYSVYPPANHGGEFGNTLPQVVFTRRTLPWERSLDGSEPDEKKPCPWLALLVLSAADFADAELPKPLTRKLAELLTPAPADDCRGPGLSEADLTAYESLDDQCNSLDLPAALFAKVAPRLEDLPYLAHVRTVRTDDKETLSRQTEGSFAVVLANRLPESSDRGEVKNGVFLVSLEGHQDHLPGNSGTTAAKNLRLAVLAHWEFACFGKNNFKVLMHDLDSGRLQRPVNENLRGGDEDEQQVAAVFRYGYTALNHQLRNGEQTVSWYRGPLLPMFYDKEDTYPFLPSADAALRYDYRSGMLDASYAAAWQLGRLLALQNQQFAQALYRYRNQARLQIKSALRGADEQSEKQAVELLKSEALYEALGDDEGEQEA